MAKYTLHIPVTQTYLVDVEAESPGEARAKGAMRLAKEGLPPYGDDDGDPVEEEVQFDIIVVSWTDEATGEFTHTNVGKPRWATEGEAQLAVSLRSMAKTAESIDKSANSMEGLLITMCRQILDGTDLREFARTVIDHYDKKK